MSPDVDLSYSERQRPLLQIYLAVVQSRASSQRVHTQLKRNPRGYIHPHQGFHGSATRCSGTWSWVIVREII